MNGEVASSEEPAFTCMIALDAGRDLFTSILTSSCNHPRLGTSFFLYASRIPSDPVGTTTGIVHLGRHARDLATG